MLRKYQIVSELTLASFFKINNSLRFDEKLISNKESGFYYLVAKSFSCELHVELPNCLQLGIMWNQETLEKS